MRKITTRLKALEFFIKHPQGIFNDLSHINYDIIKELEKTNFLEIGVADYKITQKGIDFYVQEYVNPTKKRKGLSKIFPRLIDF